eukprot:11216348-Lingulodinium_polyedra.AAC.1
MHQHVASSTEQHQHSLRTWASSRARSTQSTASPQRAWQAARATTAHRRGVQAEWHWHVPYATAYETEA